MKLVTIVFLMLGLLLGSKPAIAQNPLPLSAYERAAGASSSVPPMPAATNDSTAATTQSGNMTSGGKTMRGVGIALVIIGAGAVITTAAITAPLGYAGHPGRVAAGCAGGGAVATVGVTLIILGRHKHTAK